MKKITNYKSLLNHELGFSIQEDLNGEFNVWIDEYEDGRCIASKWVYDDESNPFGSFKDAHNYIISRYGDIEIIESTSTISMISNDIVEENYTRAELLRIVLDNPNDTKLGSLIRNMILN